MNVREVALKTLYDIEFNGTYSNAAVKNALAYYKDMSAQDKPLFTELVRLKLKWGMVKRSF